MEPGSWRSHYRKSARKRKKGNAIVKVDSVAGKSGKRSKLTDSDKDAELTSALALIRSQPGYKVVVLDLTGGDKDEDEDGMSLDSDSDSSDSDALLFQPPAPSEPVGPSIQSVIRNTSPIQSSPYLHGDLKFGEVCGDCGMMLLDSDTKRSPVALNRLLRSKNVSVCILRSKSRWEAAEVKAAGSDAKFEEEIARMGSFEKLVVGEWGMEGGVKKAQALRLKWATLKRRLAKGGEAHVDLGANSWAPEFYAKIDKFKKFWLNRVDSIFDGTTWPMACEASAFGSEYGEVEDQEAFMKWFFSLPVDKREGKTFDENVVYHSFAVLVGGCGSAPHVDTVTDMLSSDSSILRELADFLLELTLAVGYIIQGIKYFWALRPKKGHADRFIEFNRTRLPVDMTGGEREFRNRLFEGKVPYPFRGAFSMGWLSEQDWKQMGIEGISNHFHRVVAGDRYIVTDGSFHAVVNHPLYQPVAVAHDDRWVASRSDLNKLGATVVGTCPLPF